MEPEKGNNWNSKKKFSSLNFVNLRSFNIIRLAESRFQYIYQTLKVAIKWFLIVFFFDANVLNMPVTAVIFVMNKCIVNFLKCFDILTNIQYFCRAFLIADPTNHVGSSNCDISDCCNSFGEKLFLFCHHQRNLQQRKSGSVRSTTFSET